MEPKDKNVYVISLDAVDLNLLPSIYNTRTDGVVPLWSKRNLEKRNNEYYEFEIKSKDDENAKDVKPNLDFENTHCHICDIEVPKPFLAEHKQSLRHKTNVKIADIAINRMKEHINYTEDDDSTDDEIDDSVHFCASCVTVMDVKDKYAHTKSLAHKNSLILQKIFDDFLILYHCNESNDKKEKNIRYLEAKINNAMRKFVNGPKNADKTELKSKMEVNEPKKEVLPGNINKTKSVQAEQWKETKRNERAQNKTERNEIESRKGSITEKECKILFLKSYLALIQSRIAHPMFFKVQNDTNLIEIETVDGSVVGVTEENFHGFNRIGMKLIQCFICKEIFKEKVVEDHKMSFKHIRALIAPLKDKHCARQIDSSVNHCLICNTITENADLHAICDKEHAFNLNASLISDKLTEDDSVHNKINQYKVNNTNANGIQIVVENQKRESKTSENNESYKSKECNESNENVDHNDKLLKLTKSLENLNVDKTNGGVGTSVYPNKYFCSACNEYISTFRRAKHEKTAKHATNSKSFYHYLMMETENELMCRVCDVTIPNNTESLEKHILDKKHSEKYSQLLKDNRIKKIKKSVYYCEACDEVVVIKNELIHVNSKPHQIKCFTVEYVVEVTEKKEVTEINENAKNNEVIEKDGSTVENVNSEINENEKLIVEFYRCKVCDVKVPNNEHNIQEHMNGKVHRSNAEKTEDRISNEKNEDIDENEGTKKNEGTEKYEYTEKSDDCEKREVIKKIEGSAEHECIVKNREDVENEGTEKYVGPENNEDIGQNNRTQKNYKGVEKYEHFGKDEDARKSDNCDSEVIETIEGSENNEDIEINEDAEKNESSEKSQVNDKNKDSEKMTIEPYHCKVCDVKVPNFDRNIQEHMNGRVHRRNAEEAENRISEDTIGNDKVIIHYHMEPTKYLHVLYCRVCKINVLENQMSLTQHLAHPLHTSNYQKLLKDNYLVLKHDNCYCTVCNVAVGLKSEIMHVYGKKHNRILKQKLQSIHESILMEPNVPIQNIDNKVNENIAFRDVNQATVSTNNILSNNARMQDNNIPEPVMVTNMPTVQNINKGVNETAPQLKPVFRDVNATVSTNNISGNVTYAKALTKTNPTPKHATNVTINDISKNANLVLKKIDIKPEMYKLLEPTEVDTAVRCKICKVKIPYTKYNVETHINGMKHKSAHQALLKVLTV